MIRVRRSASRNNRGPVVLATLTLVLSGGAFAEIPEGLRLDEPQVGTSAESHVEVKDALEEDKLAAEDPALLWFRNGYNLRPDPGLDAALTAPLDGVYLVQFPGRIRPEWIAAIEGTGATIHDHVQSHAFVIQVPPDASDDLLQLLGSGLIRYIGPYPAEAKIAVGLEQESLVEIPINVVLLEAGASAESALGGVMTVERQDFTGVPFLRGRSDAAGIRALARMENVLWIERHEPGRLHNLEAAMSGGADSVVSLGVFTGDGVRVAVDDTGITRTGDSTQCGDPGVAAYHPDIAASRIADQWDFHNSDANVCDDDGHGTHTAGTIGGDGTNTPAWTGMAPDVTFLIYKDCCTNEVGFGHFSDILSRAASNDADIVANSWGDGGGNGAYDINSQNADRAVLGNWNGSDGQPQYMFLTISTGNDNDLTTSPATAKNAVAVGAMKDGNAPNNDVYCWGTNNCNFSACGCSPARCGDTYLPASERICFSNYGPVDTDGDGNSRIKPDVVAPGTRIHSLAAPHLFADGRLYKGSDGTSMSQPVVAGVAALMLDAYPNLLEWPEMTKARLLATAVDVGPLSTVGHGMVDAMHAVFSSDSLDTLLWEGDSITASGNERDHAFTVPAGFDEVRVYLTWSDKVSATTEVVNDLDLRVYDADGTQVGFSATYDDTVEFVRLTSGTPGSWRANVRGFQVPDPSAFYGIYAASTTNVPYLVMDVSAPDACVAPGAGFQVDTILRHDGYSAVASKIVLDLPDDPTRFPLDSARLVSDAPGRSHFYQFNEIYHESGPNEYTVSTGEVNQVLPRRVEWHLEVGNTTPDATYSLYGVGTAVGYIEYVGFVDIQVDGTPPGNIWDLASSTHSSNVCSNNPNVQMTWNGASDVGCGMDGYSVHWSETFPILGPETKVLEETATSHSQTLPDSLLPYFFNIRSVDNADNWAPAGPWWGPLRIDTVAPGFVTNLASESHLLYSCGGPGSATFNWTAAADDNCGVAGYSVSWSEDAPQLPDAIQDLGPVGTATVPSVSSHKAQYFNIRSLDSAGNWASGAEFYGPVFIDTLPAELQGLMLVPAGPDLDFAWGSDPDAHAYRVYADTDPAFSAPSQVGTDVAGTFLRETNGMTATAPVVYYQVLGTNVCGAGGP